MLDFFKKSKSKQNKQTEPIDLTEGKGEYKKVKLFCPNCGLFISEQTPRYGALACTCGAVFTIKNFQVVRD